MLFDPEDRAEVELQTKDYVLLRERDLGKAGVVIGGERPAVRVTAADLGPRRPIE